MKFLLLSLRPVSPRSLSWTILLGLAVLAPLAVAGPDTRPRRRQGGPKEVIYVSPDGNDANNGTKSAPLRTVQRAADRARAGSTIFLQDGTYKGGIIFRYSGDETRPIQLRAVHPHKAILRGAPLEGGKTGRGLDVRGNYVIVDGIKVAEADGDGIFIAGTHVTVRHCVFEHNGWKVPANRFGGQGILTAAIAHDARIEDCECLANREHGIYISGGSDRPLIRNNRLHDNGDPKRRLGGNGLQINADGPNWPTEKAVITGNISHGNVASGFSLQGVHESLIANNLLYDNNHAVTLGITKGSRNNRFWNNTLVTNGQPRKRAITLVSAGNKGPSTGNQFVNNILYAPGGIPFSFDDLEPSPKILEMDYNLLWAGSDQPVVWDEKKEMPYSFSEWQQLHFDRHSVVADPQFVDPAKRDYHLQGGSPALRRGKPFADLDQDLDGVKRPKEKEPTLGAYQEPAKPSR